MREHEIAMILKWIGLKGDGLITEQMLRDAIKYVCDMGFTDERTN